MSLVDGQVLDGKYVIARRIADGGMSTVYLGVNQRLGKEVAVKVLSPALAGAADVVERFEREARIVSRIRSPYVGDVYDFGALETGERFMVMEYLDGESLASMMERERTLPIRTLARMATQILEGLSAAHAAGVIHRDLKPDNIIVTKRGKENVVKIVDFGISKVLGGCEEARVTAAGAVLGTPLYMSPEQARGTTNLIDQRTDLYSLGVILYEAIAGEPPLTGDNVNDLLFRVALDEPTPLTTVVPSVDPGFAAIVAKAMAKSVVDRYQSADEMTEALDAWKAQFASGSLAAVSVPNMRTTDSMLAVASMTVSHPRLERVGLYARARKYAVAVPAMAVLLLLLPFARQAVSHPAAVETHAMTAPELEQTFPEPIVPATKLIPIAILEPVPVVEEKPVPVVVHHYVAPVRPRAVIAVVDAGVTEPVATAPAEIAPTEENNALPPLEPPAQD